MQVVDGVKALLPALTAQLPAALTLDIRADRSIAIRDSVHDVKLTLMLTVCLVVLVIFTMASFAARKTGLGRSSSAPM